MVYLIIIIVCSIIIYIPNAIVNPAGVDYPWAYYALAVVIYVLGEVLIDAIVAIIGRKLPEKMMNPKKGIILTRDWEMKMFEALKVKAWKDYMPDLGRFTNFPKGNLMDPLNNEYIKRYILEASYGVWIHYASVPASPLILLLGFIQPESVATWTVGVPVVFVNMVLILLPAWTLKYNLPRLVRIADMNDRFLAKRKEKEENSD
ncbi:MAG: hypothetical protein K5925_04650 [Bacilli bacterium]|nr:hypothetical protein [Bacilli bacterium]